MKAKDLIKILETDPERIIVLACDSEGNSYSIFGNSIEKLYWNEKSCELHEDDEKEKGDKKCFVLWPN